MDLDPESSFELIRRAQAGDDAAFNRLLARYRPRLQRWASGRLPRYAREFTDTDDLVQEALIGTFKNFARFEDRGEWALQAYMRQAVSNRIRDALRHAGSRPVARQLAGDIPTGDASPLETVLGKERFAQYETALGMLGAAEREAVIARLELGCSYQEIAALLDKPSADAARMVVARTLAKLATMMAGG